MLQLSFLVVAVFRCLYYTVCAYHGYVALCWVLLLYLFALLFGFFSFAFHFSGCCLQLSFYAVL